MQMNIAQLGGLCCAERMAQRTLAIRRPSTPNAPGRTTVFTPNVESASAAFIQANKLEKWKRQEEIEKEIEENNAEEEEEL
ncbi:hypothetical protein WR25_20050 [Diploscapter pachys]|uniref:Uncharacterized protein n=1 Tax=Diploscapter pachys TaxID=2018661 RepID=A0A2A2L4B3_9BILA|nr:hypothetical protein WR25_20050 [Diploscapter pachys]